MSESLTCSIRSVSSRHYVCVARGLNHLSYLIKISGQFPKTSIWDLTFSFSAISVPAKRLWSRATESRDDQKVTTLWRAKSPGWGTLLPTWGSFTSALCFSKSFAPGCDVIKLYIILYTLLGVLAPIVLLLVDGVARVCCYVRSTAPIREGQNLSPTYHQTPLKPRDWKQRQGLKFH